MLAKLWKRVWARAATAAGRLSRERLARLGWYAALAALLVLLGTASHAYRNRGARGPESAAPTRAAAALVTPAPTATPSPTPEPPTYVWPVEGEVIGEYAPDTLVWSQTLGQWQAHPGIDIAASAGEAVVACADGVVSDAWRDALWGNVVEIDHPDGCQSTYAGLSSLNLVEVGAAVEAGQVIGAVGDTAACEADMPWHLHFGLKVDGITMDYTEWMHDRLF